MLKTVQITSYTGRQDDCIVLRRYSGSYGITLAFPFHEDMSNLHLPMPEALALANGISELADVKLLAQPTEPQVIEPVLFPETFISNADQSRLSGLLDQYSTDSYKDLSARTAIHQVISLLGLN
ncbi:hypothetical protein [Paenibacillus sp. P46E]|uniref:hypothetical protein n=1 Tax=Paenibacillus sp. P46E TaxID=1349436 RepID=UPI000939724C|nr:hypothetical protein [Paenibacillus sp. P46E]OKP97751.1 hypothetical protein A3849_13675 [Paenibacillus sp. P46E]